jgi:protein-disulfide isomerase
VKIVFKHLPLKFHNNAAAAAAASEAAHLQGKFWEFHDLLFANQKQLTVDKYNEYAQQLGLNVEKFKQDFISTEVKQRVEQDSSEAGKLGITGTPGFFVNGRFLRGAKPFEDFKKIIDEELARGG